jgi:ribonuclease HII
VGFLIIDGHYFKPYKELPYQTVIKGDSRYYAIAAASVLAKTYRDDWMTAAHDQYPIYNWIKNKGYATADHRAAILAHGMSPMHRRSFQLKEMQGSLF